MVIGNWCRATMTLRTQWQTRKIFMMEMSSITKTNYTNQILIKWTSNIGIIMLIFKKCTKGKQTVLKDLPGNTFSLNLPQKTIVKIEKMAIKSLESLIKCKRHLTKMPVLRSHLWIEMETNPEEGMRKIIRRRKFRNN